MVSKKRKEKMSWSESLLYKYSKTYRQIWKNKETLEDIKAQNIQTQVMLQALAEKSDKIPETGLSVSEFVSFLNYTVDITKLPPAKGKMRALQLADAEILRIFDEVCRKHNLQYWLDFGTLLGAVRHQGFIPWDDDMDVAMPRESYNRLFDILEEEFKGTELHFYGKYGTFMKWDNFIRISYHGTYLNLDVFPYDFYYKPLKTDEEKQQLSQKMIAGREFYNMNFSQVEENEASLTAFRKQLTDYTFKNICEGKQAEKPESQSRPAIFKGIENWAYFKPYFYDYDDIFPLQKRKFEGMEFNVPHNQHKYLAHIYGNYWSFPENLNRHEGVFLSGIPNNIDEIITKLQTIRIK